VDEGEVVMGGPYPSPEERARQAERDAEFNKKMQYTGKPAKPLGVDGFSYILAVVLVGCVIWYHSLFSFLTNVILVVAAVLLVVNKVTRYITLFVGTIALCIWGIMQLIPFVFK
jgi:hypothetical protein